MGNTDTDDLYGPRARQQGIKRAGAEWTADVLTRPPILFCRLAWVHQDRRSATLRYVRRQNGR